MNTLLREAAASVQMGWLLGAMTVVFLVCFVGWIVYAYHPRNRELMEEMARMPLGDGGDS